MKYTNPSSPEFWEALAKAKECDDINKKCLKPETWDKAAATYDDLEKCKDYQDQINTILNILQQKGVLDKKNIVIDVACGTGTYAVKMAPYVKEVVALDISKGMLGELRKKIERYSLKNIKIINEDWMNFSSENKFDLVFCSMTPLLRSVHTIKKFIKISSRYIGIVTWAGVRKNMLLNEVSKKIFGKPFEQKGQDITFIFNYLYSLGFAPNLTFFTGCWERIRKADEQIRNLIWRLEMKRSLSQEEKDIVEKIVYEHQDKDGYVRAITTVRTCFMFIDKKQAKESFDCF